MLKLSSSLETLTLFLQNNKITDEDILHFSEGILAAGPQLSTITLSFLVTELLLNTFDSFLFCFEDSK